MGRKGNSRFPSAKIKKIIQENQEIGKLCNSIPPIIQKSLELFLNDIMDKLNRIRTDYKINKLSLSSLKLAVEESEYDFMKDVLEEVEDLEKNKKKHKRKSVEKGKGEDESYQEESD